MRQVPRSLLAAVALCVVVPLVVSAQQGADEKPKGEARRSPLPSYFGKIAVSDTQRDQLYQIQDEYDGRIDALQAQVKALIKERDAKMETVLTPGQKLRMTELRDEAKQKAAKPKPADASTDAAAPASPGAPAAAGTKSNP